MLNRIVTFLQGTRSLYWGVFFALCLGLLASTAKSARTHLRGEEDDSRSLFFVIAMTLLVFWGRLPSWIWPEQNLDESQAIATAITLFHDPRFWISVDAGSHGPMVSGPLLLARLVTAKIDYAVARCLGAAFLAGSLGAAFDVSRRWFGTLPAKLAILPLTLAIASTSFFDFVAYNGEQPLIFFLALGGWLAYRSIESSASRRRALLLGSGFALGLVPWVKLQGAPICVAAVALWAAAFLRTGRRNLWLGALGLVFPTIVFFIYIIGTGALTGFYRGYLMFAQHYADREMLGWTTRVWRHLELVVFTAVGEHFITPLCVVLGLLFACNVFVRPVRKTVHRHSLGAVALLFAASEYAVYRPGNTFPHYLLLLSVPYALVTSGLLQTPLSLAKVRKPVLAGYFLIALVWPLSAHLLAGASPISRPVPPDSNEAVAREIERYAHPGDRLVVWGWAPSLHVLTQLPQGVRYAAMWQLESISAYPEFSRVFVSDFSSAPVPVVVDAVGPSSIVFPSREVYGFERFPDIAALIRKDYELVSEPQGTRMYVLRTRLASSRGSGH